MKREEATRLLGPAQQAADWCRGKLEMRAGGFGKDPEHIDDERAALHMVHSIAVCEVARLQVIVNG